MTSTSLVPVTITKQDWLNAFKTLQQLSNELGVGDPFNYNRGREIHTAFTLGLTVSDTLSGADAYDENGACELKSTIGSLKGVYTGISVQPSWDKQVEYIINNKIGKYPNHYIVRYDGAEIAEAHRLTSNDVLMLLIPKIKKQFNSPRGKDPRIGVTLTAKEIRTYGELVYESN